MSRREDVITHLQIMHTWAAVDGESGRGIDPICCKDIVAWTKDTLDLIGAKPRVMTKDEVMALEEGAVAWLEERYDKAGLSYIQPMMSNGKGLMQGTHLTANAAVMSWRGRRFWTARPTDEQREAAKWNERAKKTPLCGPDYCELETDDD